MKTWIVYSTMGNFPSIDILFNADEASKDWLVQNLRREIVLEPIE